MLRLLRLILLHPEVAGDPDEIRDLEELRRNFALQDDLGSTIGDPRDLGHPCRDAFEEGWYSC